MLAHHLSGRPANLQTLSGPTRDGVKTATKSNADCKLCLVLHTFTVGTEPLQALVFHVFSLLLGNVNAGAVKPVFAFIAADHKPAENEETWSKVTALAISRKRGTKKDSQL